MHILYLVGTPIGNLEDISLRALRILGEVGLIAAEDTRVSGKLLKRYSIDTPMLSYYEHNEAQRIESILTKLESADVALITDAGMPGLSDPGYQLVRAAIERGVKIIPIPGPSAAVATLVVSGLPADTYLYHGFLPRQKKSRRQKLKELATLPYTIVLFEAPHRLLALLEDVEAVLGNRQITIGREVTKLHEEVWRGAVNEAIEYFSQTKVRGEITLVIEGKENIATKWTESDVRMALQKELRTGASRKEAAASIAEHSGWRKKDVYNLDLDLR